jgi:hypothetical protein
MRQIEEADWRVFRQLHPVALERFCERIVGEIERIRSNEAKSFHQRYIEISRLIKKRDRQIGEAFNDLRRSTALLQIATIRSHGLWTEEEFMRFSPDIREAVELLEDVRRR